jgi:Rieske Fe-S protein
LFCAGSGFISSVLASCQSAYYANGVMEPNGLSVLRSDFTYLKKGEQATRTYIIVHNDKLEFPIYLYRFSDTEYSALWMKCSHQGSELQASGDHLYCSSHGSEFDKNGKVMQGPADKNLRTFTVSVSGDKIIIGLS